MFDTFKARAEAVSAEVHRFPTKAGALAFILNFLDSGDSTTAVCAPGTFLDGLDVRHPRLSFEVTRERAAAARVGISQVEWAVADTGTLVQDAAPVEQRLVSTLPEIHIALVPSAGLLPDMPSALARIHPSRSAYISMITGPSRTADIERVLTIGVHGPQRLIIVFVDELETAS
jgi:L-lactate dehydrogenase complex protein LldG